MSTLFSYRSGHHELHVINIYWEAVTRLSTINNSLRKFGDRSTPQHSRTFPALTRGLTLVFAGVGSMHSAAK